MAEGPRLYLVADDYCLSPGVSEGIRLLLSAGRLSGTGCMTLFPEWPEEAPLLHFLNNRTRFSAGLHLTLTDFAPLSGTSVLAPDGRLPPLKSLLAQVARGVDLEAAIHAELDLQLSAFQAQMGRVPDYLDGHQHVHFLRPVRSWLIRHAAQLAGKGDDTAPWLRGAPALALSPGLALLPKVGFVRALAKGFDAEMRAAGYRVQGPLAGFYDWSNPSAFRPMAEQLRSKMRDGMVVMCHPGKVDALLRQRDSLTEAREAELQTLLALDQLPLH